MPIVNEIAGYFIREIETGKYDIAGHGCNCQNRMNTGIAPLVKARWPGAFEADSVTAHLFDNDMLGSMSSYWDVALQTSIVNLYTQDTDRFREAGERDVSYDGLADAFEDLNSGHGLVKNSTMLIPKIGAGLGGGDWEIIRAIINRVTPNLDITVIHWNGE